MSDITAVSRRIGERVKEARAKEGLSQDELAELADLSRTSITNIEAGRQGMDLARAALVARALRIEVSDLFSTIDLSPLMQPPPPHEVTIRRVWEVCCETCGGTVIDCPGDRRTADESKRLHIEAERIREQAA